MTKPSIRSTFDSRTDGQRYHVSYRINDRTVTFQESIDDPFVNGTVTIRLWDAVKAFLFARRLEVTVIVGGTVEAVHDVLELDDNTLIPGRSRDAAFRSHINERLGDAV